MASKHESLPVAHIGFELPWPDVHDATGYCAAEMAVEQANAAGDLPCRVKLVNLIDDRDPDKARVVAAAFGEDPAAIGVLGPLNSPMAAANQDVYYDAGLAQLTSEATSPLLTERGYRNFFRLVAGDDRQGRAQARVAVQYLGAQRIAVLHDGSAWGKPLSAIFTAEATRLGSPPVLCLGFGEAERCLDFDALVKATVAAKPDLVYFAVYWNPAHIIAHQLRYARLAAPFLGTDALKAYPYLEVPGLDRVKPYHTFAGADIRVSPRARAFFTAFATRYPLALVNLQYAAEGYDAASLLIEALRRARNIDRGWVLAELQNIGRFEGISGSLQFDVSGNLLDPEMGLYRCEDGLRKCVGSLRDLLPGNV
jgi:branched-chain amino acid transport system substrate-binding protein